jgi:hypothetical protein
VLYAYERDRCSNDSALPLAGITLEGCCTPGHPALLMQLRLRPIKHNGTSILLRYDAEVERARNTSHPMVFPFSNSFNQSNFAPVHTSVECCTRLHLSCDRAPLPQPLAEVLATLRVRPLTPARTCSECQGLRVALGFGVSTATLCLTSIHDRRHAAPSSASLSVTSEVALR